DERERDQEPRVVRRLVDEEREREPQDEEAAEHEQRSLVVAAPADQPQPDDRDAQPEYDPHQRIEEAVPVVRVDPAVVDDLAVEGAEAVLDVFDPAVELALRKDPLLLLHSGVVIDEEAVALA